MESISREDYLRAIYHLMEENKEVRSVEVADYLNISKPSVSEMLKNLDKDGLIGYKRYSKINLTRRGFNIAKNLTARHRIIEAFLKDTLKINPNAIHEEAHRLEHAFSTESIEKIRKMLHNPKTDPHGKPIPRIS
ncbi:metal-dependent transcriptional regulator [Candidatus Woesearchaeota archaeon]|nr:metal-dependent transcriptional regulator [Candidatus Woesearchaeota archaeon]